MMSSDKFSNPPLLIRAIDKLNCIIGDAAACLMLPVVLTCFVVVILRYVFGIGFIWLQELFIWAHSAAFLSAAGYVFQRDKHVRVDIFYGMASERAKAWINIVSVVGLLFVMCGALFYISFPQIMTSWRLGERSVSLSGMDYVYVLKTFILVFCAVSILHGISLLWQSYAVLRNFENKRSPSDAQEVGDE